VLVHDDAGGYKPVNKIRLGFPTGIDSEVGFPHPNSDRCNRYERARLFFDFATSAPVARHPVAWASVRECP
jgi:hypothetical protein